MGGLPVGQNGCAGDHSFSKRDLGAGLLRLECETCGSVVIDLDAAEDGRTVVTEPGLFGRSRPTIFSVLREEYTAEWLQQRERQPRHAQWGLLRN